jgi:hypothetical protein
MNVIRLYAAWCSLYLYELCGDIRFLKWTCKLINYQVWGNGERIW